MKKIAVLTLSFFFVLCFTAPLLAEDKPSPGPSGREVVEDVLWIRPLGLVRVIIEATAYVISLPATVPLKKMDCAYEFLIEDPFWFTFERPIGEM
jgi:hypothetical protein